MLLDCAVCACYGGLLLENVLINWVLLDCVVRFYSNWVLLRLF
jgi:hypothetical protein